ncbi:TrkH family potassium uptake protein [Candidatus Caldatribacterium saccharofermentans]|uniref:Trk family potassium uptake protein n=1 Tax=Candidatus Caldatribacterium saccharofermentans TaxID=1454753 RepID=A0A7V4TEN7_9BACT
MTSESLLALLQSLRRRLVLLSPASLVLFGFSALILIGTVLLLFPFSVASGNAMRFIDALFTATSAVCVTGLVVVDTGTFFSLWGQIIILILIQFGGLGYMTVATLLALALRRRIEYRDRLAIRDSFSLDVPGGAVRFVLDVLRYVLWVEGVGFLLLFVAFLRHFSLPQAFFSALFHSVSAFCNAGFSVFSNSLESFALDPLVNLTVIGLIVIGGIGFVVIRELVEHRRLSSLHAKTVVTTTVALIALGTLFLLLTESSNPTTLGAFPFWGKLMAALFQAVTPRTAGFSTIPIACLRPVSALFLMFLMFVGASPGGTGGGVKTTTLALLLALVRSALRGQEGVALFHRRVARSTVRRALAVFCFGLGLVFFSTTFLFATEKGNSLDLAFEAVSAFGTVGLSRGVTSNLSDLGKLGIIVTMFLGRVGIFTALVAMGVARERKELLVYPEERVLV